MVMFKVNKDGVVDLSVMLMVADLRPLLPQCLAASQTGFHGYVTICLWTCSHLHRPIPSSLRFYVKNVVFVNITKILLIFV